MRFGPDITERICKEIEKVPNIRHVCNKVGIDHSTFYRWMALHPTFRKRVITAHFLGRQAINGAAETVIIKGVQEGDRGSAKYWLGNNDPRYMYRDKAKLYSDLLDRDAEIVNKPVRDGTNFETVFKLLYEIEQQYDHEASDGISKVIVRKFCDEDQTLIDLCFATFEKWKIDKEKDDED